MDCRCFDCGTNFKSDTDRDQCDRCKAKEDEQYQPNIDTSKQRSGDYYNFKHHGTGYVVPKR